MNSKADDVSLFRQFNRQHHMNLITNCRATMNKIPYHKHMTQFMSKSQDQKIYQKRADKFEPIKGLVKDIFELNRFWMGGDDNNHWLLAAIA